MPLTTSALSIISTVPCYRPQFEFVAKNDDGSTAPAGSHRLLLRALSRSGSRMLLSDHDATLTVDMGSKASSRRVQEAFVSGVLRALCSAPVCWGKGEGCLEGGVSGGGGAPWHAWLGACASRCPSIPEGGKNGDAQFVRTALVLCHALPILG